jgi:hypothetical protein
MRLQPLREYKCLIIHSPRKLKPDDFLFILRLCLSRIKKSIHPFQAVRRRCRLYCRGEKYPFLART